MPADQHLLGWELVERDELLGSLTRWTADALAGDGRLVLVGGEAGAGKSALLRRWRELLPPGTTWREGSCESLISPRPLAPFLQMDVVADHEVEYGIEEGEGRGALFSAVRERLATDRPGVVVVEDAHWGDEATLDLLWHLARRVAGSRMLLAVTFRTDESAVSDHFPVVLGELSRESASSRLDVAPLTRDGVARLVGGSSDDVDRLVRLTGGNAYYLTELVMADSAVPPSVRDAIHGRLARLSSRAREGGDLAALVGRSVPPGLLEELLGPDVDDVVDELVGVGLWTEDDAGPRFRHELTREVVADTVPARVRRRSHGRILAALQDIGSTEWARLAHHAQGARDRTAVVRYARLAGATAARVGSMREAAVHFESALAAYEGDDPAEEATLVGALAQARALRKDYQGALALRGRERQLWLQVGDRVRAAQADLSAVWVHNTVYQLDDAFRVGRSALDELSVVGDASQRARAHAVLARLNMLHDRIEDALLEIAHARSCDDAWADSDGDLLDTEACCLSSQGRDWRPRMERALALARQRGDSQAVARALYNTADILRCDVRLDEALTAVEQALTHASAHGLTTYAFHLVLHRAAVLERMGRWAEAEDEATAHLTYGGDGEVRAMPAQLLAVLAARRGVAPAQEGLLDEALRQAEPSGQPQNIVPVRLARAEAAWLGGDEEQCRAELGSARALTVESTYLRREIELWAHRCGLEADPRGLSGPAADEVCGNWERAATGWHHLGAPYDAALALSGSDREGHLVEAVKVLDELGAVVPARRVRHRMRALGFTAPVVSRRSTRAHPKGLTLREQEVLECLADGLRNREVAERLFIAERTVATHVSSVMRKLDVPTRAAAGAWFHSQG